MKRSLPVVINELRIGVLSARSAFDRVVHTSLESLTTSGLDQSLVMLLDSLDEALTFSGDENLVTLLGHTLAIDGEYLRAGALVSFMPIHRMILCYFITCAAPSPRISTRVLRSKTGWRSLTSVLPTSYLPHLSSGLAPWPRLRAASSRSAVDGSGNDLDDLQDARSRLKPVPTQTVTGPPWRTTPAIARLVWQNCSPTFV